MVEDMFPLVKIERSKFWYNDPNDPVNEVQDGGWDLSEWKSPGPDCKGLFVRQLEHNPDAMWVRQGPRLLKETPVSSRGPES